MRPGDVVVRDRGYARIRNFTHARENGGEFITRIGWQSVRRFETPAQRFDLFAVLPDTGAPAAEHAVRIGDGPNAVTARLISPPDIMTRDTVASIDCTDWLTHHTTEPGELAEHRQREAMQGNGPQSE